MAAAGTGPIALDIAAPTDFDGSTPTITIDTVPSYGVVQYFNGSTFVTATANTTLTPAELASLRYTPPASGEFGGQTISYTATDGAASNTGTIAVTVLAEDTQPANLYFSALGSTGNSGNPDLYTLDQNGNPLAIPLNVANGSSAGEDGGFFQFAGNLYFNANGTATSGTEALYELAPNGTVTAVSAGANSFDGFFDAINGESSNFTEFDGSLYFGAEVNTGGQVVKLNADGTSQVITLDSGFQSMAGQNGGFVEFNGDLLLLSDHHDDQRLQSGSHPTRPERQHHRDFDPQPRPTLHSAAVPARTAASTSSTTRFTSTPPATRSATRFSS